MSNYQVAPEVGGVRSDIFSWIEKESVQPDSSAAAEDGAGENCYSRIGGPWVPAPERRNSATGTEFD